MSLKEFTKEIFTREGLNEDDINVYLRFLRIPRATISQVWLSLGEEYEEKYEQVQEITEKLIEKGFLKKIEGIVDRYIPLEPFFELFTNQSENFRDEIATTKDKLLTDQNERFEKLESIQNDSIQKVQSAVDNQIKAFFEDSDAKNSDKKAVIDKATNRFTDTTKQVEADLHSILEEDYSRLTNDVNKVDQDADQVWDNNSQKFTEDNNGLNQELTTLTETENNKLKELTQNENSELETLTNKHNENLKSEENNIHMIIDTLESDLKSISNSLISDNESKINTATDNVNKIIADLLADFSERISNLETELKQSLDEHVERHKNVANELKPKMEQILEKYLERMNKVITDLKNRISKILSEHISHVKNTTQSLQSDLKNRIEQRHSTLEEQTNNFKENTLQLIDNLLARANDFTDFSEDMANKGFFWIGKKKKYKAKNEKVIEDVLTYTEPMKEDFVQESEQYVQKTRDTTNELKSEIDEIMARENQTLSGESEDLDKKAQDTINAELETLATDMASEIDNTLQGGIKDCSETTIKLKDSLEKSLKQHHSQYDDAINHHKEETLRHYTNFDGDIKRNNETWVKDSETKFSGAKREVSTEIDNQVRDTTDYMNNQTQNLNDYKDSQIDNINEHLQKTTTKNDEHSQKFENDVESVKKKQREIYDALLKKVRGDFDKSKSNISEKIDSEIKLWNVESADMNGKLKNMLADHKSKYEENAKTLETSLSNTTQETTKDIKDAVANFTLEFMTSIDDATEFAEKNEEKLSDIHQASKKVEETSKVNTWHTVGRNALISAIKDAIYRVKSSVIVVMPTVIPEILKLISEFAFQKKAVRFLLTSHWDMGQYGNIIQKMKQLGNIQFRNLTSQGEYYACTRDAEEIIIAPATDKEGELISIHSTQEGYAKLYSSVIGPMFLSNSRPIK